MGRLRIGGPGGEGAIVNDLAESLGGVAEHIKAYGVCKSA